MEDGEQWIVNEWQPPRELPESIGISLSGGGHRAALFAIGALVAVIDAGLVDRVVWIASASGGSLTSGYVAARGGLRAVAIDPSRMIADAVRVCSRRGGTLARPPLRVLPTLRPGRIVEAALIKSWLRDNPRLVDLRSDDAEHVFLAVDLGSLEPVLASRRFVYEEGVEETEQRLIAGPGGLRLATVVRASSAFPGLPATPLDIRILDLDSTSSDESMLVLGDGGLWNNLATVWDSDQQRIGNFVGAGRTSTRLQTRVDLHLVVDASAPVRRTTASQLSRPLVGWLRSAARGTKAMLQSTVAHNRRLLGWESQWNAGGRTSHINLVVLPTDVCAMDALLTYIGGDAAAWSNARVAAASVRTTLFSVSQDECEALIALSYGLTAAHLAEGWSVPYARFNRRLGEFAEAATT
jgi:hypothetical protein